MRHLCLVAALFALVPSASFAQEASSDGAPSEPRRERWITPRRIAAVAQPTQLVASFLPAGSEPEGDVPVDVAWLSDGSAVVVANSQTDNLTFLDATTRAVTHTVAVGDYPTDVAVTPDGRYVIATCPLSDQISIVDVATHALVTNLTLSGLQPYAVAISPDSAWAVVGLINDAVSSAFSVVDLNTLSEASVIPTTPQGVVGGWGTPESGMFGNIFTRFALSPDGRTIVLPDTAGGTVRVYDRPGLVAPATIVTGQYPCGVDVSNDATTAVISHDFGIKTVSRIDLPTRTLTNAFVGTIDFFDRLVRITPDKSHAIVAALNNVIFVNLTTGAVAANIATGSVGDLEITFDGQFLFVPNFNARVIDIPTRTLVRTITFAACVEGATSPIERRAVALNSRFREDVHFYGVNGASGNLEGFAGSGPPPEGDATRSLAISADGRTAVAGNNTSRNVTVFDLLAGTPRAWIDTGERPLGVAITPDGTTAVVCNADSDTVSIIDLATDTRVANLPVVARPAVVVVSPDSQWAYVLSVAGTDRVHFIRLQGATSFVQSSIIAGQTGSAGGYAYTGLSGMALSNDGSVLGVCISFDDQFLLVDTATRTEMARVNLDPGPTNVFPYSAAFTPDGTRAYVTNSFGDSVSVVSVNGASSTLLTTVTGIDFPSTVNVDPSGAHVYVTDANGTASSRMRVIATASNTIVLNVPLANRAIRAAHLSPLDHVLYLAAGTATGGELVRVSAAGASSAVLDTDPLSASPAEMSFSEALRSAVMAQPIPDGLDVRRYDLVANYCIAGLNSFGTMAIMSYTGTTSVSIANLVLRVTGASPNGPGVFFYGTAPLQVAFGDGFRCVGGNVIRLNPPMFADGTGTNTRNFTPPPGNPVPPGGTRYFQYWYRNLGGPGNSGFNLSDGLQVTFSP